MNIEDIRKLPWWFFALFVFFIIGAGTNPGAILSAIFTVLFVILVIIRLSKPAKIEDVYTPDLFNEYFKKDGK
jgi:hypothetical protein